MPSSPYNVLISATEHPYFLFAVLALGVALTWRVHLGQRLLGVVLAARTRAALAAASLLAFGGIVVTYASYPAYFDRVEPSITAVSWLFVARGYPLYPSPDDPHRYAHVYGPILFYLHGLFLRVAGASIELSKVPGIAAAILTLGTLFFALRKSLRTHEAMVWTGLSSLLLLAFQNISFWNRPDPFVVLFATIAALLAYSPRRTHLIGVAICAGLTLNLKITAVLFLVPLLPRILSLHPIRSLLAAGAVFLVVAALPFASPNVEFRYYIYWLVNCTGGAISGRAAVTNLEWAALLLTPTFFAGVADGSSATTTERLERWLLVAAIGTTCILAAIPGAGPYHLLPFAPIVLLSHAARSRQASPLAAAHSSWTMGLAFAAALSVAIIAAIQQYRFLSALDWDAARVLERDLRVVRAELTGTRAALGYSGDDPVAAMFRPLFVFDADPYLVDAPAVMDHQMNHIELSPETARLLRECAIEILVVRSDAPPLSTRNLYPSTGFRLVFDGPFQDAFHSAFERAGSRGHFDLWRCRR